MADFGLAQPLPNFFADAQNAFMAGQQQAQHKRTLNALAANAQTPENLPNALLQAGDLQGAIQAQSFNANASTQQYANEQHAAQIAALQRQGAVRQKLQSGDVQGARQLAAGDKDASALVDAAGQHVSDTVSALANLGATLKKTPYGPDRIALLKQQGQILEQRGFDPSVIDNFDPTDANIDATVNQMTTLADQFARSKPMSVAPGGSLVTPQGQSVFTAPNRPVSVAAGGSLVSPDTGQTVFSSPYKPMTIQNADGTTSLVQPGQPGGGAPAPAPAVSGEAVGGFLSKAIPGLQVSSAGRSGAHNAAVGGVADSMHLSDQAVDVVLPKGTTAGQVHDMLTAQGLNPTEFINEGDRLHIGWAPKPQASGGSHVVASGQPLATDGAAGGGMELAAQRLAHGDPAALTGLPMGKAGAAMRLQIMNRASQILGENGQTAGDLTTAQADNKANSAALRAQTVNGAKMRQNEQTAIKNGDLAMTLAAKGAGPAGSPVLNRWIQAGRKSVAGDPDVAAFDAALKTFRDEYVQVAVGTGQSTDAARGDANQIINNVQSIQTLNKVYATLKSDMSNRTKSIEEGKQVLRGQIKSGGQAAPTDNGGWKVVSVK